ncbi:DUF5060 domain-containing protein [Agaribacterium sp. ZY112]|uniref:DUF5060 domain-containing protein n=1 Tax=Agaribacterium sp. ZY112 TaxID=3233574 RepID=UPI0035255845
MFQSIRFLLVLSLTLSTLLLSINSFANSSVELLGEKRLWHSLTLSFDGPSVSEDDEYNPFLNYRLNVEFLHPKTGKRYLVPGFFAADGNAANSSAKQGNKWQVRFSPDELGLWQWQASFRKGPYVAVSEKFDTGQPGGFMDESNGQFKIKKNNKKEPDFRSQGRLEWVNQSYLRFAGSQKYFIKAGPDSPENLLAYADFDGNFHSDGHGDELVKTWAGHLQDWNKNDPSWQNGKGRALIGALNYLASKGLNSISFLTLNILGDDKNVFPYIDYNTYDRFDISKLEQWNIVFSHAQKKGLFLHFKTQEVENQGLLDGGGLGIERKLYYRELIARFSHHLALNWNMGEENGDWLPENITAPQDTNQRLAMAKYFKEHDPYQHHRVIHNGIYFDDLRGEQSWYTGASIQTSQSDFSGVHKQAKNVLSWPTSNGRQWAVAVDEPGDAEFALLPDSKDPSHDIARKNGLWGALMAGAWGSEWYFGYKNEHSDLTAQDWRSRDLFWQQAKHSIDFFDLLQQQKLAIEKARNHDELAPTAWVLAQLGEFYIVYFKDGTKDTSLSMQSTLGSYEIHWFDPIKGGRFQQGSVKTIDIETKRYYAWERIDKELGQPPHSPEQDWLVLIKK